MKIGDPKPIKGSLECRIAYVFKKEIEFVIDNPILALTVQRFFGYEKSLDIVREGDSIVFKNLIYKNSIAISKVIIRQNNIGIILFDETKVGESILHDLIKVIKKSHLVNFDEDQDILQSISKKRYKTLFKIKLKFKLEKALNKKLLSVMEVVNIGNNNNIKMWPSALLFAAEQEKTSESTMPEFVGFLLAKRNMADKDLYQIDTDSPYDAAVLLINKIEKEFITN